MAMSKSQKTHPTAITEYQETSRNSTKLISNQWYNWRQDNNINHYINQPPVETIQSSYSNILYWKKIFREPKGNQLNYQTIPVIQGNNYDTVAIHHVINNFLWGNKFVNDICKDIIGIWLRCISNNIIKFFIFSIAYSSEN